MKLGVVYLLGRRTKKTKYQSDEVMHTACRERKAINSQSVRVHVFPVLTTPNLFYLFSLGNWVIIFFYLNARWTRSAEIKKFILEF